MKKTIILLFSVIFISNTFAQQLTVFDYFEKLYEEEIISYEIENIEGEWISNSNAGYEIKAKVDIINGYIEIVDEGTGGGTTKLQLVLYRKKDGSALIAVSKFTSDGIFIEKEVKFLEYKNNLWLDVQYQVLPKMDLTRFMNADYEMPDFPENYYEMFEAKYDLPQYGTTIEVHLIVGGLSLICDGTMETLSADKKLVCDFLENIENPKIKLYWDKTKGKFYLK